MTSLRHSDPSSEKGKNRVKSNKVIHEVKTVPKLYLDRLKLKTIQFKVVGKLYLPQKVND
jgi:hypothetical protein